VAEIAVNPDSLRTASNEVGTAARLLRRALDGRTGELAVSGPAAWSLVAMTAAAIGAWRPYLDRLRASVAESANGLSAMAENFVATEWEAARQRRGGGAFVA
jgi:hypothetical protein